MKRKNVIGLIIVPLVVILGSCIEEPNTDFKTVYYNPSYSLPIGTLEYNVLDIIPNSFIVSLPGTFPNMQVPVPIIIIDDSLMLPHPSYDGFEVEFIEKADLSEISRKSDQVESIMFRSIFTNSIPAELDAQVYFYSDETLLSTLYPRGPIRLGKRDPSSAEPWEQTFNTEFENSRLEDIIQTTHFHISLTIYPTQANSDTLFLYSRNNLSIQLGLRAKLNVPL